MRPPPLPASGSLAAASPKPALLAADRSPSRLFCHATSPLMFVVFWSCCAILARRSPAVICGKLFVWLAPATATTPAMTAATTTAARTR